MKHLLGGVAASLACLLVATLAGAYAVPAYGLIAIIDNGDGAFFTTTYDPVYWSCGFVAGGAPTVTCTPTQTLGGTEGFECLSMYLFAGTEQGGRVRGQVSCNEDAVLSTNDITGPPGPNNPEVVHGYLGLVTSIVCQARGIGSETSVPKPPYQVTCNEPAVPRLP